MVDHTAGRITARIVSIAFIISSILSITSFSAEAKKNTMSMDKAVSLAIQNDTDLNKLKLEKLKLQNNLENAREKLSKFRKHDTETMFALPVDFKLEIKNDRNRDIINILKISGLQSDLEDTELKIADTERKVTMNVRKQFLDTFAAQIDVGRKKAQLDEDEAAYMKLEEKFKTGRTDQDVLKGAEKDLKTLRNKYQQAVKSLEKQINTLDGMIGFDIDVSYIFNTMLIDVDFTDKVTDEMLGSVANKDIDVVAALKALNRYCLKTELLLQDSRQQFGPAAAALEKLIGSPGKTDSSAVLNEYKKIYKQFESAFGEKYFIPLGMFSISVPANWAGEELEGAVFFNNSDNGLPISVAERENASKAYDKVKNKLMEEMDNIIVEVRDARKSFQDAENEYMTVKNDYEKALAKFKIGTISSEKLQGYKKAVREAADKTIESIINLNKLIYSAEYESSGAVGTYIGKYIMSIEELLDGKTFKKAAGTNGDKGATAVTSQWYIKTAIDGIKVSFGINELPKGIEAEEYELLTFDGTPLGSRCGIKKQIAVIPVAFSKSSMLQLRLYDKNGKWVGESYLDGFENGGNMVVTQPVEK
jgi:hypothetical protein